MSELSPLPRSAFQREAAAHLLRRLQFGVTPEEVDRAVSEGLSATVERLLTVQPESEDFLRAEASLRQTALAASSIAALKAWWLYRLLNSANPLREKLTLMWHNHFATSYAKVNNVSLMAQQNDLFRAQAWGDFRQLLPAVARDPAMLVWLDGSANRRRRPNENFAREVMELFALGLGHYTERDIQEAARAFTGWQLRDGVFWFNVSQHDAGTKTIFGRTGRFTGADVLELCLEHPACPRWLAYKLLRQFVSDEPSAALIDRVAGSFTRHKLQVRPVLFELATSAEFFAEEHCQALIKSPVELVVGTLRTAVQRVVLPAVVELLSRLGQDLFEPPTVKGWEGGRQWIQTSTWIARWNFLTELLQGTSFGVLREELWSERYTQPETWLLVYLGEVSSEVQAGVQSEWKASVGISAEARARRVLSYLWSLPEYQLA